mgnify:CR=1 FL=1
MPSMAAMKVCRRLCSMTPWRASAPNEVESEIIEPQEDVLRSIPGLLKMQSTANYGMGFINLQFEIGTEMNRALIEVLNRLNQVPRYPVDSYEPVISVGGDDFSKVIAWWAIFGVLTVYFMANRLIGPVAAAAAAGLATLTASLP